MVIVSVPFPPPNRRTVFLREERRGRAVPVDSTGLALSPGGQVRVRGPRQVGGEAEAGLPGTEEHPAVHVVQAVVRVEAGQGRQGQATRVSPRVELYVLHGLGDSPPPALLLLPGHRPSPAQLRARRPARCRSWRCWRGEILTVESWQVQTRGCPDFWWNFKTFISKLHNLFPSQSIFNLKAPRWAQ